MRAASLALTTQEGTQAFSAQLITTTVGRDPSSPCATTL
jgi:hypothetical protein